MRKSFFIFLFSATGALKVMAQTADVGISYGLREYQIILAQEYNEELSKSWPKFTEYALENTSFYEATKTGTARASSFKYDFPSDPCSGIKYLFPIKASRCRKKIALLTLADKIVRSIPSTSTSYSTISAVNTRITLKASSILRDINKELLNN